MKSVSVDKLSNVVGGGWSDLYYYAKYKQQKQQKKEHCPTCGSPLKYPKGLYPIQ